MPKDEDVRREMKETGLIFSTPMVKAIQEGRKTQTRRVIKPQPVEVDYDVRGKGTWAFWGEHKYRNGLIYTSQPDPKSFNRKGCPYGQVGDLLWVRETHYRWGRWVKNGFTKTGKQAWTFEAVSNTTGGLRFPDNRPPFGETDRTQMGWHKRPSIFMPRWASRTTLEITEVRVEFFRVDNLSPQELEREGGNDALFILKELYEGKWVWVLSFKEV